MSSSNEGNSPSSRNECPEAPHQAPLRLGRSIPSPSAGNAAATQGYGPRLPAACSLTPSAGILSHAFAIFPIPTQRTALNIKARASHGVTSPVGGPRHGQNEERTGCREFMTRSGNVGSRPDRAPRRTRSECVMAVTAKTTTEIIDQYCADLPQAGSYRRYDRVSGSSAPIHCPTDPRLRLRRPWRHSLGV